MKGENSYLEANGVLVDKEFFLFRSMKSKSGMNSGILSEYGAVLELTVSHFISWKWQRGDDRGLV